MQKINKWRGALAVGLLAAAFLGAYGGNLLQAGHHCASLTGFGGTAASDNFQLLAAGGQAGPVGTSASTHFQLDAGAIYSLQLNTIKPVLAVSHDTLDFGESSDSLSLKISTSTGGTLTWTVTENPDKPWLTSIIPNSGSGDGTVVITVDRGQLSGTSDAGALSITSNGGNQSVVVQISKVGNPTSVDNKTIQGVPQNFSLLQNYPNPFNPETIISFRLAIASAVTIKIYTTLGTQVETIHLGYKEAGEHRVTYQAKSLPSGIYFYHLQAGGDMAFRRMLLLK